MKNRCAPCSRRDFLRTGAVVTAVVAAGSCMSGKRPETRQLRGACMHDCPDSCAWIMTTENGKAVALRGDPEHPYTRGELCVKMDGFLTDVVYNPERVLHPLKRVGEKGAGEFERVSWDEALDDVASRLQAIMVSRGGEAILPYSFAGTMGLAQGWSLDQRFFSRLGASQLARTICGSTARVGLGATMGTGTGILPEDIAHSRFIIMWGGNPVVTNPHVWPFVEQARANGARLVSIDPLRSATAKQADRHLRPRPGTDAALALGLMHVIVRLGLQDADYVDHYTSGFDRLRAKLEAYPPERVAEITGVPADEILDLGKAYATTHPATIQVHIGMEKHRHGGKSYQAIACLPALVGAWRRQGGGLLYWTYDLFEEAMNLAAVTSTGENSSARSINMVQLGNALTDETLDPPVQALVVYNSNPATIAPNQNLVVQGLKRPDLFTVVLEHFLTDTTRYADYVLPATTQAEHLDLIVPYGMSYLSLNLPAIEPLGEARPNTDFFREVAKRMGFEEPYLYDSDEDLIRTALQSGHPMMAGITYERLQRDGWAPLKRADPLPFAEGGFPTPSGKCELDADYVAVERPAEEASTYPLHFMSPKWNPYFVNSSHANQPRLEGAAGRPRLRIHPDDAAKRGIADGGTVRVFNQRGEVTLVAEVTDDTRPGIVLFLHGWWASRIGGASANALTGQLLADMGGGSTLHDTWVEVEKGDRSI